MTTTPGTITITLVPRNPSAVALDVTSEIMEDTMRKVVSAFVRPEGWDTTIERVPWPADDDAPTDEDILRQHIREQQPLADGGSETARREVACAREGLKAMGLEP